MCNFELLICQVALTQCNYGLHKPYASLTF